MVKVSEVAEMTTTVSTVTAWTFEAWLCEQICSPDFDWFVSAVPLVHAGAGVHGRHEALGEDIDSRSGRKVQNPALPTKLGGSQPSP